MRYYICDDFIQMEYENKLFELEVDKVNIWLYIREKVYCMVMKKLGIIADSFTDAKNVTKYVDNPLYKLIFMQSYKYILPSKIEKRDYLFFTHPRRITNGTVFECTVLDDLIEHISRKSCTIEEPLWVDSVADKISHYYPARTKNLIYTDIIELKFELIYSLLRKYLWRFLYKKEQNKIVELKKLLNNKFGVTLDRSFEEVCLKHILYEKVVKTEYRKLLDKINPKLIIEYYSPTRTKQVLNIIAHEKEIQIIDIQHGMFGKNEPLMSNYYSKKNLKNYPDYLFIFGDYWKSKSRYCLEKENIISIGYPYFERHRIEYLKSKDNSNRDKIIFFSQGKIGHKLSRFASNLADILAEKGSQISIIYKTHPFERNKWKREYEWLNKENIFVEDDNHSIYDYFPTALCVVGVYTTALYEALAMGIPIFVYKEYGYEELLDLKIISNKIFFVDEPEEIIQNLNTLDYNIEKTVEDYIFKNNAIDNMKNFIEKINKSG